MIKDGEPGHRFVEHYKRTRKREGVRGSSWRTLAFFGAGLLLLVCGLLLSLPPGIPGFLLWIPGLAMIAARSKRIAHLLDRSELWVRKAWQGLRKTHRQ